jgi:hypothetical protein
MLCLDPLSTQQIWLYYLMHSVSLLYSTTLRNITSRSTAAARRPRRTHTPDPPVLSSHLNECRPCCGPKPECPLPPPQTAWHDLQQVPHENVHGTATTACDGICLNKKAKAFFYAQPCTTGRCHLQVAQAPFPLSKEQMRCLRQTACMARSCAAQDSCKLTPNTHSLSVSLARKQSHPLPQTEA